MDISSVDPARSHCVVANADASLASNESKREPDMKRSLRRYHAVIWLILGPVILAGLILSLSVRPPDSIEDTTGPTAGSTDIAMSRSQTFFVEAHP